MQTVTIYSTPTCHFCHMAKDYFDEKGVAYTDIDVSQDMNAAREMIMKSGQRGVPVIKIGENFVVGFDQGKIDMLLGL